MSQEIWLIVSFVTKIEILSRRMDIYTNTNQT